MLSKYIARLGKFLLKYISVRMRGSIMEELKNRILRRGKSIKANGEAALGAARLV